MPAKSVEDRRRYRREWYYRNRKRQALYKSNRQRRLRQWLQKTKARLCCQRCGEGHPATLQFHHSDPKQKELEVSSAIRFGWSEARMMREIEKCEVLCANCHFKHHWKGD